MVLRSVSAIVRGRYLVAELACVLDAARLLRRVNACANQAELLQNGPCVAGRRRGPLAAEQIVRAVHIASRFRGGTCLARALVARMLLARAGVAVTIAIGAAARGGDRSLHAHAWIEQGGRPIVHAETTPAFDMVWRLAPDAAR